MSGQWYRNKRGKRLDPRRRRKIAKMLETGQYGDEKRLSFLFTNPNEYRKDMLLVTGLLMTKGYHIPQEAYDLALNVPMDIAKNKRADKKLRLHAARLIRMVIKDAKEIQLVDAELEVLKKDSQQEVFIREDEEFFGNEAHAKAKRESEGIDAGEGQTAGDRSSEGPASPEGDAS